MNPIQAAGGFRTGLPANLEARYDPDMHIVLPALAVAFAAFCVWLTVRIVNRRERWAKWTMTIGLCLLLAALVGYPFAWPYWLLQQPRRHASQWGQPRNFSLFTPMEWLASHGMISEWYSNYFDRTIAAHIHVRFGPPKR